MIYQKGDKVYKSGWLEFKKGKNKCCFKYPLGKIIKVHSPGCFDIEFIVSGYDKCIVYCNSFHLEPFNKRLQKEKDYLVDVYETANDLKKRIKKLVD